MKKFIAVLLVFILAVLMCSCDSPSATGGRPSAKEVRPGVVQTNDCTIELTDCRIILTGQASFTYEAFTYITFSNSGESACSPDSIVTIKAYQNGVELQTSSGVLYNPFLNKFSDSILPGNSVSTGVIFRAKYPDTAVLIQIIVDGDVISEKTFA